MAQQMMQPPGGPMDPSMPPGAAPAPAGGQGYVIEIYVLPDGTFNVSQESMEQETMEHQATGMEEEKGQEFNSLGEVLQAVMRMIKSNPMTGDEDAQFDAGFNGRR